MMGGNVLAPSEAAWILFGGFFALLALRVPVAVALGMACLPVMLIEPRLGAMTLMQETFNAYNSFILLAVPFFLLTANLMNVGGITDSASAGEKLDAGATLVQVYTGMIYRGPFFAAELARSLAARQQE